MVAKPNGGPAFPQVETDAAYIAGQAYSHVYSYGGMTLRDYLAAQALAGYLASLQNTECVPEEAAEVAYEFADAMLAERAK